MIFTQLKLMKVRDKQMKIYKYMNEYYQSMTNLFYAHFVNDLEEYLDNNYTAFELFNEFKNSDTDVRYTVNKLHEEFIDEISNSPESWGIEVIELTDVK